MDFEKAEKHIDSADSFLTKLWKFLGKHWGKLLIILSIYGIYQFGKLVLEEDTVQPQEEQIQPVILDEYYDLDENGDTIIVRTWDDGLIDTVDA